MYCHRNPGHRQKHRSYSSEMWCCHRGGTGCHCHTPSIPEDKLCTCAVHGLDNSASHIGEHNECPRGRTGLHKSCTHLLGDTGGSVGHTSGMSLIPCRKLQGTVPHKLLHGERSPPYTAGSQSYGDLYRHYSSSHTLCKSCWKNPGNTAAHSSRTGILQTTGPWLDLCKMYSWWLIHSSGTGCCKVCRSAWHPCSIPGSRLARTCQCGREPGWCCRKSRQTDPHRCRFYRRGDTFCRHHSPHSIPPDSQECSDPPGARDGRSGTSDRCCRCPTGWPHTGGTKGGSPHNIPPG